MDKNYSDFPQSLKACTPAPLDAKSFAITMNELLDLGNDNYKVYSYYRGLEILCQEDGNRYVWTDKPIDNQTKLLPKDFVYPNDVFLNDEDYSNLSFNFYLMNRKGDKGDQGEKGEKGKDAIPNFTWTKYANNEEGLDFSSSPVLNGEQLKYIGQSFNRSTDLASENWRDYIWSRYVGDQGVPGENGYTWSVYSVYDNGINTKGKVEVHQFPKNQSTGEAMIYLGLAYNKQEIQEPDFNSMTEAQFKEIDFKWMKVKGDDGHTGYVLDMSNEMHAIPTDSSGKTSSSTSYNGAYSELFLYFGNDIVPIADYNIELESTQGLVSVITNIGTQGRKITVTDVNNMGDAGSVVAKAYDKQNPPNLLSSATFSITKTKGLSSFRIEPSTGSIRIEPANNGIPEKIIPEKISFKVFENNGKDEIEISKANIHYRYSGFNEDQGSFTSDTPFTISNANNPTYLKVSYKNSLGFIMDSEFIPFIRDGKNGEDGDKGDKGDKGANGAPGIAGAIALQHEWESGKVFYNNDKQKDYIYLRNSNRWIKLKDGLASYTSGVSPDSNFVYAPEMQNMILGEKLSVGGWIISNNKLFSQAGLVLDDLGNPIKANIILDAVTGDIIFGDNLMKLSAQGITMADDLGRTRIIFGKDATGTPVLQFLREDGSVQWDLGKDNFVVITQGTRPVVWDNGTILNNSRILPNNPDYLSIPNFEEIVINEVSDKIEYVFPNASGNNIPQNIDGWGPTNIYKWGNIGFIGYYGYKVINKGDMLVNKDVYTAGFYLNRNITINTNQLPSDKIIPDGWYYNEHNNNNLYFRMPDTGSGVGGDCEFYAKLDYYQNGVIINQTTVVVRTAHMIQRGGGSGGPGEGFPSPIMPS